MTIEHLDTFAFRSRSFFAHAHVLSKWALFASVLAYMMMHQDWISGGIVYGVCVLLLIGCVDAPRIALLKTTLYPVIFALVYAVSFFWGDLAMMASIILRVLAMSTVMMILVATTPLPFLFRSLGWIITPPLSAIALLTYRAVFLLSGYFQEMVAALYLRGGIMWEHPIRTLRTFAHASGLVMIKALEMNERMSETMRLRGFTGVIRYSPRQEVRIGDTLGVCALGLSIIIFSFSR